MQEGVGPILQVFFPALLDLSFALKFFGFLLEVESHAYIPLPVCVEAAASAAFHIAVEVAVLSHLEGGTDSVHEPSITEVFVDVDTPFRTGHRYPAVPGKVMIPVGLEIDLAFFTQIFSKVKANTPDGAADAVLIDVDAIGGRILVATEISQGELGLRFNVPTVAGKGLLAAIFST